MSEETPDVPSVWDEFKVVPVPNYEDLDWDAIIGEPPEWYYPLVGKVAVTMGGLERSFAETALFILKWPSDRGGHLTFWLQSTARLRTLLAAAKGLLPEFDSLVKELDQAMAHRNEVVHVSTGWHDWEEPDAPSGWHYEHPRTGQRVYLDAPDTKPALERALATIADLDGRVWRLYRSLLEPPALRAT